MSKLKLVSDTKELHMCKQGPKHGKNKADPLFKERMHRKRVYSDKSITWDCLTCWRRTYTIFVKYDPTRKGLESPDWLKEWQRKPITLKPKPPKVKRERKVVPMIKKQKVCPRCGISYTPNSNHQTYCSIICQRKAAEKRKNSGLQ